MSRVLQVHTTYREPGGEDAVVESERVALTTSGADVIPYVVANPARTLDATAAVALSAWNPLAARRFGAVVDDVRPDVVHVHNTWFALSPSVLAQARRRRVPVVMTVHNYRMVCANGLFLREGRPCEDCLLGGARKAVRHACYRGSTITTAAAAAGIGMHRTVGTWARLVDRFLVLSDFARARLVLAGLPADRMVRADNFVPDPGPRPRPASAGDEILFVGRISPEKGLDVLLTAWRLLSPDRLRLVVIGDGPELARLKASAPPSVDFLGRRPPDVVARRLLDARALVLPSVWYEGQPLVGLEALAAGLPVVASDLGGLPELIGDDGAGVLVPPGDPEALAAALDGLDDLAVAAMSHRSRARYERLFTPEVAVQQRLRLYRQLVAS